MALIYILGQDRLVAEFVAQTKLKSGFADYAGFTDVRLKAIGIANADNELIAGIVYYDYRPKAGTIEMSVEAIPRQRWLTPMTLAMMFQFPFLQCGCQMVLTKTSARSKHVLRMLEAMNFQLIRVPRASGRYEDGFIGRLTYEDWVDSKFCRRFKHHLVEQVEQAA